MNYNRVLNNHIHALGGKSMDEVKYEYINTSDELFSTMLRAHRDLQYPLLKESKRDRYLIANSQGLEKLIREILSEEMSQVTNEICDLISYDIVVMVNQKVNSIMRGSKAIGKPSNYKVKIGKLLGRAIGNAITRLVEELTDSK